MNPEHYTLDELERIAYISGDTERAAIYAKLQDEQHDTKSLWHEAYTEGFKEGRLDAQAEWDTV